MNVVRVAIPGITGVVVDDMRDDESENDEEGDRVRGGEGEVFWGSVRRWSLRFAGN